MKRTNWSRYIAVYGLSLLVAALILQPAVQAAEVWSDDFDDENYDGWTISEGEFSVSDGMLTPSPGETLDYFSVIRHNSSITIGTWSFDLVGREKSDSWYNNAFNYDNGRRFVEIQFMASKLDFWNQTGYAFGIWQPYGRMGENPAFVLHKWIDGNPEGEAVKKYVPLDFNGKHHIDITRNSTGHIGVYINDTLRLSYVDTEVETSSYFEISSFRDYAMIGIDNITVDDEPIYTTTPTTTTTTDDTTETTTTTTSSTTAGIPMEWLAVGIGVPVILVIVLVVWKVRK